MLEKIVPINIGTILHKVAFCSNFCYNKYINLQDKKSIIKNRYGKEKNKEESQISA